MGGGYSSSQQEQLSATAGQTITLGGISKASTGVDPKWLLVGAVAVAGIWLLSNRKG